VSVEIKQFTPEEWYRYAEEAHKAVFKQQRDPWLDRISFAWLIYKEDGVIGYVTCKETDSESLYWQYGGSIDEKRGLASARGFEAILRKAEKSYRRLSTLVENDNVNYLHLCMKHGFRVIGLRVFEGKILLELFIEFKKED
jgi:hypothetical protein